MAPGTQPTPPSSTSSNGASPDNQQFRVVRKRNRVPLSCGPCRHRKLKCNRGHPCDNCTKRGDVASCSYASPKSKKQSAASAANQTPDDMQNRIDRLEGLVLSLMTNGGPADGAAAARAAISTSRSNSLSTASDLKLDVEGSDMIQEENENGEEDSEVEQVSKGIGIMKVDNNGRAIFASDAHWYAIMAEIGEVKKYFENHKEDYSNHLAKVTAARAHENPGSAFLLQGPAAKDKDELLAAFPSKADSDRLIARYFNAYDPSVHIVHGPSFQKQYDAHWMNPAGTSITWLGMCYAMMTLALQSYHRAGDEPPEYRGRALELSHEHRRLTAQCILLADITQPMPQLLETLVLHVQAEYGRSRDAEPSVLLMTGICVRLAIRMGYHRDPGPHANISPFMGEMRRRVWTFVRQVDLLISFQFGMPAIVRSDHVDTQPPRNLYDDELHEDMAVLPTSRPSFEATPMTYMIAKSRMTFTFGQIVERTGSLTNQPTYEETMSFDQQLRDIRASHPPLLQMRSFQDSARDPANLIMQRIGLELVYLRSLFVLHRRFIAKGRDNPRYAYSRRTCIDASMEMLTHQATLHEEAQPGGRLRSVKWYISSLTTHDFLLAAMNVCMDLFHAAETERRCGSSSQKPASSPSSPSTTAEIYAEDRRNSMMRALEHCITIWESVRDDSMEAYKASHGLRVMVDKLKAHQAQMQALRQQQQQQGAMATNQQQQQRYPPLTAPAFGMFPGGTVADFNKADDDLPPEQSAAMTLGMLSSGGMSPNFAMGSAGMGPLPGGQALGATDGKSSYPASMAGLLNEPMQGERTGLTPQFSGPEASGNALNGAASPFSQMFGAGSGFTGMDGLGADIDWVSLPEFLIFFLVDDIDCFSQGAWDSYIQGTGGNNMDPSIWPMNFDMSQMGDAPMPQQQQQQQQGQGGGGASGGGVFMGSNGGTPNMM